MGWARRWQSTCQGLNAAGVSSMACGQYLASGGDGKGVCAPLGRCSVQVTCPAGSGATADVAPSASRNAGQASARR
jgi:hypothetical protein